MHYKKVAFRESICKEYLFISHEIRKAAPRAAETTVIHRIFGGHLQSQVQCSSCGYKSNTFDPFLDLSLEIKGYKENGIT